MALVLVEKWGNSLAIRLPRQVVDELGVTTGSAMAVHVEAGRLVARPVAYRVSLARLAKGITAANRHAATGWGAAVGSEAW